MGIYFSNDYFSDDYYTMVLEDIRDKLFLRKYPFLKNILYLCSTLDFGINIYNEDIIRGLYFKPSFFIFSLLFYRLNLI